MDILNDISRDNLLHFLSCYTEQVFQIILQNLTDFQNESITTFGACANFGHSTSCHTDQMSTRNQQLFQHYNQPQNDHQ